MFNASVPAADRQHSKKGIQVSVERILYTARATATGGRTGSATSSDGELSVVLATPRELGGAGGHGTNPEQLFAAGYSAAFIGAMKAVGAAMKVKVPADVSVTADVGIGPTLQGYGIAVSLRISVPGIERPAADELVAAAHKVCPYSTATRGNVDVTLVVV